MNIDPGFCVPGGHTGSNQGQEVAVMALLDYFAGQALTAMGPWIVDRSITAEAISIQAYHLADWMLSEREKRK